MAVEIRMPQLSDTMDAGKIISWNKSEGDKIERGDILAEVETDKANLEIEAFHQGTLLKIIAQPDRSVPVGEIIAYIGEPGEELPTEQDKPQPPPALDDPPLDDPQPADPPPAERAASTPPAAAVDGRVKASPLARKLAGQHNLDLTVITGSGPDGRIVKRDIERAASGQAAAPSSTMPQAAASAAASSVPPAGGRAAVDAESGSSGTLTPLSNVRAAIARRMVQSVSESPHFFTTVSINMGEALRLKEGLKPYPEYSGLGVNHLILKAAAHGLAHEPRVNCAMRGEQLFNPQRINIGTVVALEDGLIIPVVKDVDRLTLKDVVFEARAALERVRAGRPASDDLRGGTFSISNMGMFGVENFTAIINPGQGAILAVSSIQEQPIIVNGSVAAGSMMKVTLSVDHRVIDGVTASRFLGHFKTALELPALLMV